MAKFLVEHDRNGCIMCGACAAACPKFWEMGDDGKSVLKGNRGNKLQVAEKDLECNRSAADNCPANVIHITNLETKEKMV